MIYGLNFETRAVLGGATPKGGVPRTHAVGLGSGRVLCNTVKPENLADRFATSPTTLPTCPRCLRALATKSYNSYRGGMA